MPIVPAGTESGTPAFLPSNVGHSGDSVDVAPVGGMPFIPDHCVGITKKGHACTAKPVKGSELCIGHTRSAEGA